MKLITLNNGVQMPAVGFGTYQIADPAECEQAVIHAVKAGYRLIDTAQGYGNEEAVGAGIKNCGLPREELFITTKVWFHAYETEECTKSIGESMKKLGVNYLDMVLLHWPFGNTYSAWRVLEELQADGKIRAIGVSNYMPSQLIDLIHFNKIVPQVNQIETNLLCQQQELHEIMKKYDVAHQAYAPFGQGRANEMFELPAIVNIAKAHGKSTRQVALRFLLQQGITVIPKSIHAERMAENLDVFNFELSENEMEQLKDIDTKSPLIGCSQDAALAEFAMTW